MSPAVRHGRHPDASREPWEPDDDEVHVSSWVRKGVGAITLFVEDLAAATAFYAEVFDLPRLHEDDDSVVFDFGTTLVNLLRTPAALELVTPATPGAPSDGPRVQLTVEVTDVDEVSARLVALGVQLLNGPMDRPWGIRTASFRDPAGHLWEIAQ
jgi:lactoylglutathione lyase